MPEYDLNRPMRTLMANMTRTQRENAVEDPRRKVGELAEERAAAVTSGDSPGGAITLIDCAGTEKRTLAGWLTRNGGTWFFKLNGPTGLVEAEKTRFTSFLSSVDFPAK